MFKGLVLSLLLAASAAYVQGLSHNAGRQASAEQSHVEPKSDAKPGDLSAIKDQIHRIASAIETENNKQQSPDEKQNAKRNLAAQEKIAAWAPAVFWIALAELATTLIGVFLVWKTLTETRGIGQAQVRAYVSITSADVAFSYDITPGEAYPQVQITVKNTGQSPARNFIWRPTLRYYGDNRRQTRGTANAWVGFPGIGITADAQFPDSVLIAGMLLNRFATTSAGETLDSVVVHLRIDFEFEDVFGNKVVEDAYFIGFVSPYNTPYGARWPNFKLSPHSHMRDWDSPAPNTEDQ